MSHNILQRETSGGEGREGQVVKLRTSGKWTSTVTRVDFTMLELLVHMLRLYLAGDASKFMVVELCRSSFL